MVNRTAALQDHLTRVLDHNVVYSLPRHVALFHGLTDTMGPLSQNKVRPMRRQRVMATDTHDIQDKHFVVRQKMAHTKHSAMNNIGTRRRCRGPRRLGIFSVGAREAGQGCSRSRFCCDQYLVRGRRRGCYFPRRPPAQWEHVD